MAGPAVANYYGLPCYSNYSRKSLLRQAHVLMYVGTQQCTHTHSYEGLYCGMQNQLSHPTPMLNIKHVAM